MPTLALGGAPAPHPTTARIARRRVPGVDHSHLPVSPVPVRTSPLLFFIYFLIVTLILLYVIPLVKSQGQLPTVTGLSFLVPVHNTLLPTNLTVVDNLGFNTPPLESSLIVHSSSVSAKPTTVGSPEECIASAAAALLFKGSGVTPLWTLARASGLPERERRLLLALNAQLPPVLRCAPKSTRVLLLGLGCQRDAVAATSIALVLRDAMPFVELVLEDEECPPAVLNSIANEASATAATAAIGGRGGGDGGWDTIILRSGDRVHSAISALNRLRNGGSLIIEGIAHSFAEAAEQPSLHAVLSSVKNSLHCKSGGCDLSLGPTYAETSTFLSRAKAVDCMRDVCAVHTWSDEEKFALTEEGVALLRARGSAISALRVQEREEGSCVPETSENSVVHGPLNKMFWSLGLTYNTDKVFQPTIQYTHFYMEPYTRHFGPQRCQIQTYLEIGLGCDMHYPPGSSFSVWLDFLPNARVTFMEYDAACVVKFNKEDPKNLTKKYGASRWSLFSGDQRKSEDLLAVNIDGAQNMMWDIVVDDGGHTMLMQIVTLQVLMPHINPGGKYHEPLRERCHSCCAHVLCHDILPPPAPPLPLPLLLPGSLVLEDIHTSFLGWVAKDGPGGITAVGFVDLLLQYIHHPRKKELLFENVIFGTPAITEELYASMIDLAALVRSIDCSSEMCILTRWTAAELIFLRG
jgi:hypothetical protein